MAKGSDSRRRVRRNAPRTIDLAASDVKEKTTTAARREEAAGNDSSPVPPAEAVAFDHPTGKPEAVAESAPESLSPQSSPAANEKQTEPAGKRPEPISAAKTAASSEKKAPESAGAAKSATPQPAARASRSGFGALAAAGLLGGIVALLLIGGLNEAGLLRYVPLVGGLAASQGISAPDSGLADRVAALEKAGNDTAALATKLDTIDGRLGETEKALAQLREAKGTAPADDSRLIDLMDRVDELANRIADAETEIVRLSDAANAGPSNAGADPAAVKALESRLSTLAGSTAKMTGEIDALSGRVTALEDKVSANAEAQTGFQQKENAARILAGNALRDAYHRGIPFADLLQSLEKITGDSPAIAALKADAARGVASDDELKRRFADLTGAILSASAPKQEGVVNRLIANARSLVEIRPAGPVEGDTPQAIVSRIEADLDSGTLEAALAEWQALPEAARAASQDWADRLKARIAADKALDQVLAGLGLPAEKSR